MNQIPQELLDLSVEGYNLEAARFGELLGDAPLLLVFLRELGCIFCHRTVTDLRALGAAEPRLPAVLFVHPSEARQGDAFFRTHWPEARAISDPELRLYEPFGLARGRFWQRYGPHVIMAGARAYLSGSRQGPQQGDDRTLPGTVLLRGQRVLQVWRGKHVGDLPSFSPSTSPRSSPR